jgi:uncharacterized protein (DUF952 family)
MAAAGAPPNDCGLLYHLVPAGAWDAAKAAGTPYFPATYETDGFIHLTKEPHLLLPVANHFYKAAPGPWRVLELDSTKLAAKARCFWGEGAGQGRRRGRPRRRAPRRHAAVGALPGCRAPSRGDPPAL